MDIIVSMVSSTPALIGTFLFLISPTASFTQARLRKSLTTSALQQVNDGGGGDGNKYNEERLIAQAINWCGVNSLMYTDGFSNYNHAPVALVPNTFSQEEFNFAETLQPIFNELVDKMARDRSFIVSNLAQVAKVDDFTNKLLDIFSTVPDKVVKDAVHLGIHRSDYMFNGNDDGSETLLQIEINTIAASFAQRRYWRANGSSSTTTSINKPASSKPS